MTERIIELNNEQLGKQFCNNYVRTSKYTWWNFLPKNLFEQLRRVSNFYFLISMILNLMYENFLIKINLLLLHFRPSVQILNPITSVLPVVFILAVGMLKDGYEDVRRARADKKVNSKKVRVFRNGKFQFVETSNIRVGDFVILRGFVACL